MSEFPYPYDAKTSVGKLLPPTFQLSPQLRTPAILLAILVAGICVFNATVIPNLIALNSNSTIESAYTGIIAGIIGAEAGLLVIAAVLGPSRGLLRHLAVVPVALSFILAWLVGYGVAKWLEENDFTYSAFLDWDEVLAAILVMPLLTCASELPLWFFRSFLRWRIELVSRERIRCETPHLSIAGILIATTAVAIALTSARLGHASLRNGPSEADWWFACGIAVAFAGGISLFTLPVCTWAALRCPSWWRGLLVAVVWLTIVGFMLIGINIILDGHWPPWRLEFWLGFCGISGSFALGLMGTLGLARMLGYRLLWGRESSLLPLTSAASEAPLAISVAQEP